MLSEPKARTFWTFTNKRKARSLVVPHIALEDTILAGVFWIAGAPRAVVSTRLRLPSR